MYGKAAVMMVYGYGHVTSLPSHQCLYAANLGALVVATECSINSLQRFGFRN